MQKLRPEEIANPQHSTNISKNISQSVSQTERQAIPLNELWTQLSRYRDLKELPLNLVSQSKDQLWRESPCTLPYPNRNVSIDRIERFRLGSIYYRDNINEQKKVFTETEKPQLLLKNFRRQVQEASHSKHKYSRKFSQASAEKAKTNINLGKTMPLMNIKFYEVPDKIQMKYDRNGTRSSFKGDYDVKQIIRKFKQTKQNFSSSRRLDLALPLNFNPGPGKYFSESNHFTCSNHQTSRPKRLSSQINSKLNSERQFFQDSIKQN